MHKTLYVTDLDGTLLHSDKTISPKTVLILNEFIRQGNLFTYATARSIISSSKLTSEISFQIPVITRNGTVLADHSAKQEIEVESFSTEQLTQIKILLNGFNIPGFITAYLEKEDHTYYGYKWYLENLKNPGFSAYLSEHKDDKRLCAVMKEEELYQGNVSYFTFIGEKEELDPIYASIKNCPIINCNYEQNKYGPEYWLEIFPRNASKAKAIEKLKCRYACDKVIVFGDSFNDIPMFQIADESYAVENAVKQLKEIASSIIGKNDDDGVANWLKTL